MASTANHGQPSNTSADLHGRAKRLEVMPGQRRPQLNTRENREHCSRYGCLCGCRQKTAPRAVFASAACRQRMKRYLDRLDPKDTSWQHPETRNAVHPELFPAQYYRK